MSRRRNRYDQGNFSPTNPEKYIGTYPITYRSSWELTMFRILDAHPEVLNWASESFAIPYFNPLTNKVANYYPDLFVVYNTKSGSKRAEVIEIKPAKEAFLEQAKSKRDKLSYAVNQAKWEAAMQWCHKQGFQFRIMTEQDLFRKPGKKK